MKKLAIALMVAVMAIVLLAGCQPARVYRDGTFTAFSDANDRGYMEVEITIKNDKITAAHVHGYDGLGLEKPETYRHQPFLTAKAELPKRIVAANSWDIDLVSGATTSSNQVRMATLRALQKARVTPTTTAQFFDGTYMAISDRGERGWAIAWVTIGNDKITNVVFHETTAARDAAGAVIPNQFIRKNVDPASPGFYQFAPYHEARIELPKRFVAANSATVDVFTGATGTSTNVIAAVTRAIEMAKRR
ncbi:MAG: Electron transport complex subunit RsxG [Firmicutes bacterium]|nr:Electron transport complex subunit RsxG [Bacillota bacterium]